MRQATMQRGCDGTGVQELVEAIGQCGSLRDVALALAEGPFDFDDDCRSASARSHAATSATASAAAAACTAMREWADSAAADDADETKAANTIRLGVVRLCARFLRPRLSSPSLIDDVLTRQLMEDGARCAIAYSGAEGEAVLSSFVRAAEAAFLPPLLLEGFSPNVPGAALHNSRAAASPELNGITKQTTAAFVAAVGRLFATGPGPGLSSHAAVTTSERGSQQQLTQLREAVLCAIRLDRTNVFTVINGVWRVISSILTERTADLEALHRRDLAALRATLLLDGGDLGGDVADCSGGAPPQLFSIPWLLCVLLQRLACSVEPFIPLGVAAPPHPPFSPSTGISAPDLPHGVSLSSGCAPSSRTPWEVGDEAPLSGVVSTFAVDTMRVSAASVCALHAAVGVPPPLPLLATMTAQQQQQQRPVVLNESLFMSSSDGAAAADGALGGGEALRKQLRPFEFFVGHFRRALRAFPQYACSPVGLQFDPAVPPGLESWACRQGRCHHPHPPHHPCESSPSFSATSSSFSSSPSTSGAGATTSRGGTRSSSAESSTADAYHPFRMQLDPGSTPASLLLRLLRGLAYCAYAPGLPMSATAIASSPQQRHADEIQ